MNVGIVGAGRIGGMVARQAVRAGHSVMVSFGRDQQKLQATANELGGTVGQPADALTFGDVVVLAVPWGVLPLAISQMGDLTGHIIIDTTNQFGGGPMPTAGQTAAAFNQSRMPGARYTKSFNTLTSGFQDAMAGRTGADRVVQWICGDDTAAKETVAQFIESMGFAAVDVGGTATCAPMEAPRRPGAVYGEEYHLAEARAVVEAIRAGRPIPPAPHYGG